MAYLMESVREGSRLLAKGDEVSTIRQLYLTGIADVPRDGLIVDAGCGAGFCSRIICEILEARCNSASLVLLDGSEKRLCEAQEQTAGFEDVRVHPVHSHLDAIPLESECADYIFCRFVFEYLENQEAVFSELVRLLAPGGKLVVGDLDYNCLTHYPVDPNFERKVQGVIEALMKRKLFDPFAGRRLYSYFRKSELECVKVHVEAHHLFYGELAPRDEDNVLAKLDRLIDFQHSKGVLFGTDMVLFKEDFMRFFRSPERFSYTPLILVEGCKKKI